MKEIVYIKGIKWLGLKIDTDRVHCDVRTDVADMPERRPILGIGEFNHTLRHFTEFYGLYLRLRIY